jgi:hypothetical protein
MLITKIITLVVGLLLSVSAEANLITVEWNVNVTKKYDYTAKAYDPSFVPFTGLASTTFNNVVTSTSDYGTTTITTFGGQLGTNWVSPITQFIGPDPYGGGLRSPQGSVTFFDNSDFANTFIEDAAFKAYAYSPNIDGTKFWAYDTEIRAMRYTPYRGGTGVADYGATPNSLIAFYRDFAVSGQSAYFYENYVLFDQTTSC